VDAAAQGGPEEVMVLLRLLSVVGYVEAYGVQYEMKAVASGSPKTRRR
jgi:hypothetical protein